MILSLVLAAAGGASSALPPLGGWTSTRGAARCTIAHDFGKPDSPITLRWRALPLSGGKRELIVERRAPIPAPASGEGQVTVAGGPSRDAEYRAWSRADPDRPGTIMQLDERFIDDLTAGQVVTITREKMPKVAVAMPDPRGAVAAMRACQDDVMRAWGLDPAHERELTRVVRPLTDPRTWVQRNDWPWSSIYDGRQGTTVLLYTVSADGQVSACKVVESVASTVMNEAACAALTARARFEPPLDAAGKPTHASRVVQVNWVISKD